MQKTGVPKNAWSYVERQKAERNAWRREIKDTMFQELLDKVEAMKKVAMSPEEGDILCEIKFIIKEMMK